MSKNEPLAPAGSDATVTGWRSPPGPGPSAAGAIPPTPRRPWWKRTWGIAAIGVGVVFVLGSVGNALGPGETVPTPTPTATLAVALATRSASPSIATTTSSATPAPTVEATTTALVTAEPTPEPTAEPTPEPTAKPTPKPTPVPAILKKSGRGDRVVKFAAQDEPTYAKITAKGAGNFAVVSYTGSEYGDLLVNEIGSYSGSTYMAAGVNRLKVTSSGSWTIEIRPVTSAKHWDGTEALAGKGDSVVQLTGSAGGITTIKNKGRSNFAVVSYSAYGDYLDLLVNEIGSYNGEVLLPDADPIVLSIHAVGGTWSISAVGF